MTHAWYYILISTFLRPYSLEQVSERLTALPARKSMLYEQGTPTIIPHVWIPLKHGSFAGVVCSIKQQSLHIHHENNRCCTQQTAMQVLWHVPLHVSCICTYLIEKEKKKKLPDDIHIFGMDWVLPSYISGKCKNLVVPSNTPSRDLRMISPSPSVTT